MNATHGTYDSAVRAVLEGAAEMAQCAPLIAPYGLSDLS